MRSKVKWFTYSARSNPSPEPANVVMCPRNSSTSVAMQGSICIIEVIEYCSILVREMVWHIDGD